MNKSILALIPVLALLATTSQAQTTNIITNAYGPATIGSGTTSLITNGATITGDITNNGQLRFQRSSSAITNNYAVSGSGSVTVASASAVTLTASNSFTGPLTANNISGNNYADAATLILSNSLGNAIQGNLVIGNATSGTVTVGAYAANQFGSNSVIVFNSLASGDGNAAYLVMRRSQTVAGLSGTMGGAGGAIEVNQFGDSSNYGSQTLTVNVGAGTNYTLNGGSGGSGNIRNVDGSGSSVLTLVKSGAGTQTLTNVNIAQTGGTIVNDGTLVVQGGAQNSANITVNSGNMTLSGASAIAAYSGTNVNIASGSTFRLDGFDADSGNGANRSGNAEFGKNSSSGSPLVISGAGTWLITGASSNSVIELGNNSGNSLRINMAQGGLINVASGALRSGGYSSPDWTSNRASLNVASGAVFELWDGDRPITVDALTGGGVIGNALGNNDVTLNVGVANGSGTFTGGIANNIKGATGNTTRLTKLGTGTQVLSGTNTYSGVTTVGAGVLEFDNPFALYSNNVNGTFWNANYFTVTNGATLSFAVGGAGQFSTSNITTILTNGLLSTSGKGFLSGSSVGFDVAGGNFTLTNNLSNSANGALGLVSYGGRTLTLTGSNSYTGTTRIDSATTLQVGNGGNSGTLGTATVTNSGVLAFNRGNALTVSNAVTGSGALSQIGTGTTTLTGGNTYTGTTTISAGTLQVGSGGTSGTLGSGNVTNNATLAFNRSDAVTVANVISGSGTLNQQGLGTTILTGNNSYAGTTTISSGTLQVGSGGTSGTLGSGSVINNSALTFNRSDSVTVSNTISGSGALNQNGSGTTILTGNNSYSGNTTVSAGALQIGNGGTSGNLGSGWIFNNTTIAFNRSDSLTVSNNITGTGSLRQLGSGTLILTQNAGFTGGISISAGTLQLGNGDTSSGAIAGNVTNNGTIIYNRSTVGMGGNISGTGNLIKLGNSLISLQGSNSYTGATTVSAGTLSAGSANAFGSNSAITVSSGASLDNGGYNVSIGSLSGAGNVQLYTNVMTLGGNNSTTMFSGNIASWTGGGLMKIGTGTFILSGNNTYTGETVINSGTLATLGNERLANTGSVTVNSGGAFKLGGNETIGSLGGAGAANLGANNLTLSSGSFSGALEGSGDLYKTGSGVFTLSGTSAGFTGDLYLQGGSVVAGSSTALNANNFVLLSAGSTFTANQNLVLGGIDQNNGTINGSGTITAVSIITRSGEINGVLGDLSTNGTTYNSGMQKLGTGTTILGAANTYSGTTKVSEGTLALGGGGSLATNSSAQINSGATLDLAAKNQSLKDVKVNGSVAGSGSLTVTGTLSGSGTINPDTVVAGTHSPGNSPGIQTFGGSLTYQPGSTMVWQLADNTTNNSPLSYDQVIVGGNLTFNGATSLQLVFNDVGSLVNWTDSLWTTDQSWTIYQVSGSTTGLSNLSIASYSSLLDAYGNEFGTTLAGASFSITQNGNNIVLNYAVPEPSTYILFGLGALALVIAYRRKSQQAGS